jgi:hypothetical protein
MQHTTETTKQYQCRHIFTDGRRCASPCLRGEEFCYYHHTTRKPIANPKQRRSHRSTFHLPLLEDRSAIQSSIGQVLQRIASNDIDPRRAGLLLYGLQIASLNLPKQQNNQRHARPEPVETVEEITIDPTLGVLAPRAEVSGITKPKSVVTQLIERMLRTEKEEEEAANPGINEVAVAVPAIVPILQATEDDPDIACSSHPNLKTVISTLSAVERAAHLPPQWRNPLVAFAVACSPQRHPKTETVISTGGRTHSAALPAHIPANFHRLDSQSIATPKSKFPNIHTP